ncbi:MarR family winged helix-turn-helix transcriptional regulator [Intestinimonas sp.]|uniref:MarR family winged helix-turn-helix transcriptional regulator n=1 Tax=Intestinimonas sp. TaxID=1965293 RepID=UPI002629DE06|nr:MarR family transcriptional regulator [Intestinimonas sp.]
MHGSNDILMTYLRVSQHMSRLFRCHFGRLQLTFPQALVLNVLGAEGPMPISTLAERTGSANSTVSGIVDRLEKLELARRDRSGTDRRIIYVAVTDKYQTLRAKAEADVGGYFASVLSTMSPQDRDMVAQSLLRLDEALLAKERADRLCPESEEGGNRGLK